MGRRAIAAQAAALITLIALAGCFAAGGDKSGGSSSPHELVLANSDGNLDGVPSVARFVQRAEALSGGKLTVRVESRWRGGEDEPRVIEDVAAGRADLGWAGTRAFDLVGVAAFRPLHAPFLVGTYAAETAVVSDHALIVIFLARSSRSASQAWPSPPTRSGSQLRRLIPCGRRRTLPGSGSRRWPPMSSPRASAR